MALYDQLSTTSSTAMPVIGTTVGQVAIMQRCCARYGRDARRTSSSGKRAGVTVGCSGVTAPGPEPTRSRAGLNVGTLIGGAPNVEVIFHLNGLGRDRDDQPALVRAPGLHRGRRDVYVLVTLRWTASTARST